MDLLQAVREREKYDTKTELEKMLFWSCVVTSHIQETVGSHEPPAGKLLNNGHCWFSATKLYQGTDDYHHAWYRNGNIAIVNHDFFDIADLKLSAMYAGTIGCPTFLDTMKIPDGIVFCTSLDDLESDPVQFSSTKGTIDDFHGCITFKTYGELFNFIFVCDDGYPDGCMLTIYPIEGKYFLGYR